MLNSRALDKIIGESNQLQNEETKCSDVSTDVQISKMPKEHYQIVIKKKKKNDERQEEKKNEDQDVNIEQENEGERRDEERKECGSKDSIKVMSNKNPKEKLREEKVYTMFQPFCRIKDENKKREDKNNGEAVGGSKSTFSSPPRNRFVRKNSCSYVFSNKTPPQVQRNQ